MGLIPNKMKEMVTFLFFKLAAHTYLVLFVVTIITVMLSLLITRQKYDQFKSFFSEEGSVMIAIFHHHIFGIYVHLYREKFFPFIESD